MSLQRFYKGRGIVLHTIKYGESSMIAHVLTDSMGRQSFLVRGLGSHRGRGSKAALFQPLFTLEFEAELPRRGRGDLHYFREVRSGLVLSRTPFDFKRSTIALFIAEMLYRLIQESEVNLYLFDFAWRSVEALDSISDDTAVANFHLWFLAQLSRELGFVPSDEYRAEHWLSIADGQYVASRPSGSLWLSPSVSESFALLLSCELSQLDNLRMGRARRVEVLEGLIKYYSYHLDSIHNIQSIKILRELF